MPWANLTGEAANDYVVWALYKENTDVPTPGSGVTLHGPYTQSTGGFKYEMYIGIYKVAGGESGTKTIATWTNSNWRQYSAACWRGAITTETPIVTIDDDIESSQNAEPVHPGITIARSNSGLLWFTGNFTGTTAALPTGTGFSFTEIGDGGETTTAYDITSIATGATGTITGDLTDPEYAMSVLVELATEAGGAATVVKDIIGMGIIAFAR